MASVRTSDPGQDVEEGRKSPSGPEDLPPMKPLTADEAVEIAIGETNVEYSIESDNSPYLEVRANVPNTDDPSIPVNTVRMWFLGVIFTLVCSCYTLKTQPC
jgi:hypothetical protein